MDKQSSAGFQDHLPTIVSTLDRGGTILHYTDTHWHVSAALHHTETHKQLLSFATNKDPVPIVLLSRDIATIKQFIVNLHPRVETLLSYHKRPLTVLGRPPKYFPDHLTNENGELAVRLVTDTFTQYMLNAWKGPLISVSAFPTSDIEDSHFGKISSQILERVNYVAMFGRNIQAHGSSSPVIRYNRKGQIEFICE